MKKILVPLDFSEQAKLVLPFALEMAKKMKATPTLYFAIQKPFDESEQTLAYGHTGENIKLAFQNDLLHFVEKNTPPALAAVQVEVKTEIAPPVESIIELARDLPAEMVIMGMRNKNIWDDFLFGSVTESVLKKMNCPILVVPPQYEYQPPDQLLYLFHFGYSSLKNLQPLSRWATEWGAKLQGTLLSGQDVGQKEIKEISEKLQAACTHVHSVNFDNKLQKSDFRKEISNYIEQQKITILAMECHDKVLQKLMHRTKDTGIVRHLHLPVLFLPHREG